MDTHGCRTDKGYAAYRVLLGQGGRNEEAIDDGHEQTGELSEAIKECAAMEDEAVSDVAEQEIDYQVVKGSDGECNTCSYESKRIVAPPDKQSEQDVEADLKHQERDAVPLGKYAVSHRQSHASQE